MGYIAFSSSSGHVCVTDVSFFHPASNLLHRCAWCSWSDIRPISTNRDGKQLRITVINRTTLVTIIFISTRPLRPPAIKKKGMKMKDANSRPTILRHIIIRKRIPPPIQQLLMHNPRIMITMSILVITRRALRFRYHTRLTRVSPLINRQCRSIKRSAQPRRNTQLRRTPITKRSRTATQDIRRVRFAELDFAGGGIEFENVVFDGPLDDAPLGLGVAGYFLVWCAARVFGVHGVDVGVEVGAEHVSVADHGVVWGEDAEGLTLLVIDDEFIPGLLVLDCLPV